MPGWTTRPTTTSNEAIVQCRRADGRWAWAMRHVLVNVDMELVAGWSRELDCGVQHGAPLEPVTLFHPGWGGLITA
ncbi:hypothetical protein, partial [Actinomadura sp. LOL_011]|uniref:hypothetical protein n=1 Tax=Actinomadura sp. LOL_011 TaxID=3345410 RepID=UPI003A812B59